MAVPRELQGISDFLHEQRRSGHGHVLPRNDGDLARCGGPSLCHQCRLTKEVLDAAIRYNQMDASPSLTLFADMLFEAPPPESRNE